MEAVLDWVVLVMRTVGSPGVGLATALETVFPPVPSELVLPLAGYTASQGHYSLVAAIAWATKSTSRSVRSTRFPGRATASSGAWSAMSDLMTPRASESRGVVGQLAYDPAALRAVLGGKPGAYRDTVLMNAGAGLVVAGKAPTLADGVAMAARSIDEGTALRVLEKLVLISNE